MSGGSAKRARSDEGAAATALSAVRARAGLPLSGTTSLSMPAAPTPAMPAAALGLFECNEVVRAVRGSFDLLYRCLTDRNGLVLATFVDAIRRHWLVKFASYFPARSTLQRDAPFVRAFEAILGRVRSTGRGGQPEFEVSSIVNVPAAARHRAGAVAHQSTEGRIVRLTLLAWAMWRESVISDFLCPTPFADGSLSRDAADAEAETSENEAQAAEAAETGDGDDTSTPTPLQNDTAAKRPRLVGASVQATEAAVMRQMARAERRLQRAKSARAALLVATPRVDPWAFHELYCRELQQLFADLLDGVNGYSPPQLVVDLFWAYSTYLPADPTQPVGRSRLEFAERQAHAMTVTRSVAQARTARALVVLARTTRDFGGIPTPGAAKTRTVDASGGGGGGGQASVRLTGLCDGIAALHREAERVEGCPLPVSLARIGDTPADLEEAMHIRMASSSSAPMMTNEAPVVLTQSVVDDEQAVAARRRAHARQVARQSNTTARPPDEAAPAPVPAASATAAATAVRVEAEVARTEALRFQQLMLSLMEYLRTTPLAAAVREVMEAVGEAPH